MSHTAHDDVSVHDGGGYALLAIAGVPCRVRAPGPMLRMIEEIYAGCSSGPAVTDDGYALTIICSHAGDYRLTTPTFETQAGDADRALGIAIDQLERHIVSRLAASGVYAIHAAALRHDKGVLLASGPSGAGKTTLALGLARAGLGLLTDELALADPDRRTIWPFPRSLHVRPGTSELVVELRFLEGMRTRDLGGGPKWTLPLAKLGELFRMAPVTSGPLSHVVLLTDRRSETGRVLEPLSSSVAALELIRATPAAAERFSEVLDHLCRLLEGFFCAQLHPAPLDRWVEELGSWLDADG